MKYSTLEWGDGVVTDLESLGETSNCGNALAINDRGETVGTSENHTDALRTSAWGEILEDATLSVNRDCVVLLTFFAFPSLTAC